VQPTDLNLPTHFTSFRTGQDDAAIELLSSPHRFLLLSAPTGSGKSLIYMTLSRLLDARTLVLTGTKGLQTQLMSDFHPMGMVDIRGHANYPCGVPRASSLGPRDLLTTSGLSSKSGASWSDVCTTDRESCSYLAALSTARESNLVITNYAYWLTMERVNNANALGEFDLLILDEGHTAPDWLASFCKFSLHSSLLRDLLDLDLPKPDDDFIEWAKSAVVALSARRDDHRTFTDAALTALVALERNLSGLLSSTSVEWLTETTRYGIKLSPVWAREFAEPYLFRSIPHILLTSATLSPEIRTYMGISINDSTYLEAGKGFDHRRRPFIYVPTTRVGRKMSEGDTRVWMNRIDSIIDGRLDRKGIIHTRSYARAKEIVTRSRHADVMLVHRPRDTAEVVAMFKNSTAPSVLVSPAVEEGFDFPGLQCSYQIIVKVPFLDMRDPITKARSKTDECYSNYVTGQSLVQMVGRGMRAPDDICETLIIDDHWSWFRKSTIFPHWFRRAWRRSNTIPTPPGLPVADRPRRGIGGTDHLRASDQT